MTLAPLIKVLLTTALIGNEFNSIIKNFSLQRAKQSDGHEYTSTLALNQYSTFWGLMDNDKDNNGNATFNKLEVLLSDLKLQKSAGLLVKNVLAQNNVSDGVIGFVETVNKESPNLYRGLSDEKSAQSALKPVQEKYNQLSSEDLKIVDKVLGENAKLLKKTEVKTTKAPVELKPSTSKTPQAAHQTSSANSLTIFTSIIVLVTSFIVKL